MTPLAECLALLSAVLLAMAMVVTRYGLAYLGPRAGAAISIPTAAAFIAIGSFFILDVDAFHPRAAGIFVAVGLFFPAFATLLIFESNARVGPAITGALSSVVPLFAMAGALLFLGEVPTKYALLGSATVIIGVWMLFAEASSRGARCLGWVVLLPLSVAMVRGAAQSSLKAGLQYWPDPYAALVITYLTSAVVVRILHNVRRSQDRSSASLPGALWFMGVGLLNATAIFSMYTALNSGSVAVVSALISTFPLFVVALERLLFKERATRPSPFAVILIVFGVLVLVAADI